MTDQRKWLENVKQGAGSHLVGNVSLKDKLGGDVTVEWSDLTPHCPAAFASVRALCDVLTESYLPVEFGFLRAHPDSIKRGGLFQSLAPLLEGPAESIEWPRVEEEMRGIMRQLFTENFVKSLGASNLNLLVSAKCGISNASLGGCFFLSTEESAPANVFVPFLGVDPKAKRRGIGTALMASLFRCVPSVARIGLRTRTSNTQALGAYRAWGFTENAGESPDWIQLTYDATSCQKLQAACNSI